MDHNLMSTGSVQNDLIVVALLFIGMLILVFFLAKAQAYIDKKVIGKLKAESHARYLTKMGKMPDTVKPKKNDGKSAPVAVELHDEVMRQKIEKLRLEKLNKNNK